ncbi:MAG: 3-oxoacyl-[acyl-carrier-protein] synthase III C-terminal domain-containing protein [Pseudomonadota bacterium]
MSLSILGTGVYLPPAKDVRTLVAAHGGDLSKYSSWANVCVAEEDDHPGNMAGRALQDAIDEAGVQAADLDIVVFAGASRDYPPSWSASTEAMRIVGASSRCVGLDVTAGCAATLAAIELVDGWLALRGGGMGAVVVAERWSFTIDYANPANRGIWTHGDSGAALILGQAIGGRSIATYMGAEFSSVADNNGHVLVPYGGTRAPSPPPGVDPYLRVVSNRPAKVMIESYANGFAQAHAALRKRFGVTPSLLLCNQMSPNMIDTILDALGMTREQAIYTGDETGHLGGADIVVGLRRLAGDEPVREPVLLASSTAYAFGTALLVPPGHSIG